VAVALRNRRGVQGSGQGSVPAVPSREQLPGAPGGRVECRVAPPSDDELASGSIRQLATQGTLAAEHWQKGPPEAHTQPKGLDPPFGASSSFKGPAQSKMARSSSAETLSQRERHISLMDSPLIGAPFRFAAYLAQVVGKPLIEDILGGGRGGRGQGRPLISWSSMHHHTLECTVPWCIVQDSGHAVNGVKPVIFRTLSKKC